MRYKCPSCQRILEDTDIMMIGFEKSCVYCGMPLTDENKLQCDCEDEWK